MYVKKNFIFWLAALALVIPLFIAGTASAKYMSDGAVQNATNGGWNTPNDMICIVGVHTDGTLDIADGVTNARDCIYLQTGTMNGGTAFDLTGMTTSAACTTAGGTGNDGAKHSWATSFCTKSLKGLDRTQQMCQGIGGTWVTTGKCVAYGRQFKGQDASGTPLAIGTKGTTQGAGTGYCYTTMNMTTSYGTTTVPGGTTGTICPAGSTNSSTAYDWAYSSSKCTYAKGIAGYLNAALTKADGSTYAANSYLDLSLFNTMGDCLAAGASWANWTGQAASTTSIPTTPSASTIPAWVYNTNTPDADNGCLHCHSSLTEYNGPAEREKDSYVKTGHKNMLRAVKAGMPWAGPDGVAYTTDGANTINFMTTSDSYAKITVGGVDQNLYYIYGDWMAALPTTVYGTNGYSSAPTGSNNGYTCYACHATGASDSSGPVPGVQSIGTSGYAGIEPQATFPGISFANNPKWDLDGIQCSRCHNATVAPISATQIAASSFKTTAPTSGGMGALASGTGRNNLCFGCHQSIDKAWPAGTAQYDPTKIPVGVSHGAQYGREFNGHVLGNSFLNSVHAEYAGAQSGNGSITLNALGKYDLTDPNGTSEYGSSFQGFTCWQSSTGNSPAKTKADGTEIKTKSDCETLYGAGTWRADASGDLGTVQGSCSTCHDVHNSLFVASQKEAAMRKTCEDCHVNNATTGATISSVPTASVIRHPSGSGTPFDAAKYDSACVVCHMASQAEENGDQVSMPVHVWRINTNASYNTFPTMAQFYGGSCSVHTGPVQNAPSKPVVYLSDVAAANSSCTAAGTPSVCCTGNKTGTCVDASNCTAASGTWTAATKNRSAQTAPDGSYTNAVWVDLDLACGQCHGGSLGTSATHNGALYISKAALAAAATGMHSAGVVSQPTASTPVVSHGTVTVTAWTVSFADTSTSGDGTTPNVNVNWGDGNYNHGVAGDVFTHTYASTRARSYTINHVAISSVNSRLVSTPADRFSVNVPQRYTISGIITTSTGTTPMANAYVFLKAGTRTVQYHKTDATGTFSFSKVLPGNYAVHVYKFGTTFGTDATISGLSSDQSLTISSITP